MEDYLILFGIIIFFGIVVNKVTSHYDWYIVATPKEKKQYNISYYSEGTLLPNPYHIEYKMIADTMANSWIYEEQWQDLVNENHDAPIVEIEVKLPLKYKYIYTIIHVFLANAFFKDQKEYLNSHN